MVVVFLNDVFSYVTVLAAVCWALIGSFRAAVDKDSLHLVRLAAPDFVKLLLLVFLIYLDRIKSVLYYLYLY